MVIHCGRLERQCNRCNSCAKQNLNTVKTIYSTAHLFSATGNKLSSTLLSKNQSHCFLILFPTDLGWGGEVCNRLMKLIISFKLHFVVSVWWGIWICVDEHNNGQQQLCKWHSAHVSVPVQQINWAAISSSTLLLIWKANSYRTTPTLGKRTFAAIQRRTEWLCEVWMGSAKKKESGLLTRKQSDWVGLISVAVEPGPPTAPWLLLN